MSIFLLNHHPIKKFALIIFLMILHQTMLAQYNLAIGKAENVIQLGINQNGTPIYVSKLNYFEENRGDYVEYFLIIGNKVEGPLEEEPILHRLDSIITHATVKINGAMYLIAENTRLGPYVSVFQLVVSPDYQNFAYVAESEGKYHVFYNNELAGTYDDFGVELRISNDGKQIAYYYQEEKNVFVIKDKKKYGPFEYLEDEYLNTTHYSVYFDYLDDHNLGFFGVKDNNVYLIHGDEQKLLFTINEHKNYDLSRLMNIHDQINEQLSQVFESDTDMDQLLDPDYEGFRYYMNLKGEYAISHFNEKKSYFATNIQALKEFSNGDSRIDSIARSGNDIVFSLVYNDLFYVIKNSTKYGPYQKVQKLNDEYSGELKFNYSYNNEEYIFYINKQIGPLMKNANQTWHSYDYTYSVIIDETIKKYILYRDNEIIDIADKITIPYISDNIKNGLLYFKAVGVHLYFIADGKKIGPLENYGDVRIEVYISPDEKYYSFSRSDGIRTVIYINRKELWIRDALFQFNFSDDSENIVYSTYKQGFKHEIYFYFNKDIIATFQYSEDDRQFPYDSHLKTYNNSKIIAFSAPIITSEFNSFPQKRNIWLNYIYKDKILYIGFAYSNCAIYIDKNRIVYEKY